MKGYKNLSYIYKCICFLVLDIIYFILKVPE